VTTDEVQSEPRVDEDLPPNPPIGSQQPPATGADTEDDSAPFVHEATHSPRSDACHPLKIVLNLEPQDDRYQALIAIAREGCDPFFRTLDSDSLVRVLDQVPSVVAEAEGFWQVEPRYPRAQLPGTTATTSGSSGTGARSSPARRARGNAISTTPQVPSAEVAHTGGLPDAVEKPTEDTAELETRLERIAGKSPAGQLPLFG